MKTAGHVKTERFITTKRNYSVNISAQNKRITLGCRIAAECNDKGHLETPRSVVLLLLLPCSRADFSPVLLRFASWRDFLAVI
jgi:hypothetical protein